MTPIIAIDGPTASGKGTLCKRLGVYFSFDLLDTGLLYRALGKLCFDTGVDLQDSEAVAVFVEQQTHISTDGPDLRQERVGSMGSQIAPYPRVRKFLLDYQRDFGKLPPNGHGAILDGRDIGTVIFPDTPYKLYLTASPEVRAERRHQEMQRIGVKSDYADILKDVIARDERDTQRKEAPLIPATDAHILDTSTLDADQVFDLALEVLGAKGLSR